MNGKRKKTLPRTQRKMKKETEKCCVTEVDGRKSFKENERLTVSDTAEGLVRVGILLYLALGLLTGFAVINITVIIKHYFYHCPSDLCGAALQLRTKMFLFCFVSISRQHIQVSLPVG